MAGFEPRNNQSSFLEPLGQEVYFEKLAEMNVIEAAILLRFAKPYLGAKYRASEKNSEREDFLPYRRFVGVQRFGTQEAKIRALSRRSPRPKKGFRKAPGGGRGTVIQHSLAGFRAPSQRFAERAYCPVSRLPRRRGFARATALRAVAPGCRGLCYRRCCARPCGALAVHIGFRAEQSGE